MTGRVPRPRVDRAGDRGSRASALVADDLPRARRRPARRTDRRARRPAIADRRPGARRGVRHDDGGPAGLVGPARRSALHRDGARGVTGAEGRPYLHDPATLEIVRHALGSVADEMALIVARTAYSATVRDALDYSTGLINAGGELIAQGLGIALHLGSFPSAVSHVAAAYGDRLEPGDVFILNDPYGWGGIHLPDIYIIKPIFHDGGRPGVCRGRRPPHRRRWRRSRAATPRRRPTSSRRDCGFPASISTGPARSTGRSSTSSAPTSACRTRSSATSGPSWRRSMPASAATWT